jgi:methyltransferase (TIGR00027 family)
MKPEQPSRTAEYMAFFRAWESVRPKGKRLFVDPFARHFIRPSSRAAVWFSTVPVLGLLIRWYADRRLPGARTSAIARTRLIDESIRQALGDGLGQIVVLGAGFDCRTYRLPGMDSALVFEVDHPDTLAYKLSRLRSLLPRLPTNVRYVPVDFNRESLPELLAAAGFSSSLPTVFLWEGVTNYLAPEAVDAVLRYVSSCGLRSRIIFTYVHSGALDGSVCFEGAAELLCDVARLGEPWTFGLDPVAVPEFLSRRGLQLDRDASAHEYRTQYWGEKGRRMRGYDFYHVVIAYTPAEETETETAGADRDGALGSSHA